MTENMIPQNLYITTFQTEKLSCGHIEPTPCGFHMWYKCKDNLQNFFLQAGLLTTTNNINFRGKCRPCISSCLYLCHQVGIAPQHPNGTLLILTCWVRIRPTESLEVNIITAAIQYA